MLVGRRVNLHTRDLARLLSVEISNIDVHNSLITLVAYRTVSCKVPADYLSQAPNYSAYKKSKREITRLPS